MSIIDVLNVRDMRAKATGFSITPFFGKRQERLAGFRKLFLLLPILALMLAVPNISEAGAPPPPAAKISAPPAITTEATGPLTWVELGVATATCSYEGAINNITKNKNPPFPVGTHEIVWTVKSNECLTATATQAVTITDTTPPIIYPPADLTLTATEAQGIVNLGSATANDLVDGALTATPTSTGPFTVGYHSVVWTATDAQGNVGAATQFIVVTEDAGSGSGGAGGPGVGPGPGNIVTSPVGTTPGNFTVTPSGSAAYQISIAAPPGVKGMQPKLALSYSNQSGDGLMGVGWMLKGLSSISRCGANIYTDGFKGGVYLDDRDRFCLDGQRLISVGPNEYRTQSESWQKIIASGNESDPSSFTVYTKGGKILEYGTTTESRIEASGTTVARIWALTRASDQSGNYYAVSYYQNTDAGEFSPKRIDYGTNVSGSYASISFSYGPRDNTITKYQAGSEVNTTQLLTGITSLNGFYKYREYNLSYNIGASTNRYRLQSVQECASDGTCLSPTTFNWQEGINSYDTVEEWLPSSTGDVTTYNPNEVAYHHIADLNGDGKSDYMWRSSGIWYVAMSNGSGFDAPNKWLDQIISVEGLSVNTGNPNHQFIADFNGDGKSDYMWRSSGAWYVAMSNGSGFDAPNKWLDQTVAGLGVNSGNVSHQFVADFNGDAKLDYMWRTGGSWYVALSNGSGFDAPTQWLGSTVNGVPSGNASHQFIGDFNGDGNADYMWKYGNWYVALSTGTSFEEPQTWLLESENGLLTGAADSRNERTGDFNGDGISDYMWNRGGWNVVLSTGNGFTNPQQWLANDVDGVSTLGAPRRIRIIDINGDGKSDYMWNGNGRYAVISTGNGFTDPILWLPNDSALGITYAGGPGYERFGDFDGDGRQDHMWWGDGWGVAYNTSPFPDLMAGVVNGLGSNISVEYLPLTDSKVYGQEGFILCVPFAEGASCQSPQKMPPLPAGVKEVPAPIYVVAQRSTDDGIGGADDIRYIYRSLRYHSDAGQSLGFRSMSSIHQQTGRTTTTDYEQLFEQGRVGTPILAETSIGSVTISSRSTVWASTDLGGTRNQVHKSSDTEIYRELNNGQAFKTVTTAYQYDAYNNPTSVAIDYGDGHSQTTANTYWNDETSWIFGRLTRATVTAEAPGSGLQTRTSTFEYSPTGLLLKEIVEPDNPQFTLTTAYTHDGFGNRASTTVSGQGITSRTTSTVFDSTGRFPAQITNALGNIETRQYDPATGQLARLTGPNNLTTVWAYDGFGRKVHEGRADQTITTISYSGCDTSCPVQAIYMSITEASGAPTSVTYHDVLNRKIRTSKQAFNDNSWLHSDVQYDSLGRVEQKSLPYLDNASPLWTLMQYDLLGRVVKVTEPGDRVSTTTYNGLSTTAVNPLYQSATKLNNSQGKLDTVTDAAGSQYYVYDAFGNLTKVTDPLGNVSSMSYDIRGRKIAMDDPDMGQWSYEYNVLGELTKQTDAKGQVTTNTYDILGRLISRTLPEGTSTWTYDTASKGIGKLATVSGFNSTSQALAYDSLGRLASVTKTINAISLTVSTTYDAYGRVEKTTYPGTGFTTKNVYKPTGHLWQVLGGPDSLLYWQANNVNAFGQITDESYGNLLGSTRTYDAVTSHLLSIKTQGAQGVFQDLGYTFDAIGNLTSRSDVTQGLSESFTYDALNRLTGVNGPSSKTLQYDTIGNITFKSDVGSYIYGGGGAGPHAVTSVSGTLNATYTYDANGNMKLGAGRDITYASFNKPSVVGMGGNASAFYYDADYNRVRKATVDTETLYFDKLYEQHKIGVLTTHKHFIYAGGKLVSIHEQNSLNEKKDLFVHTDHLGSIESITDELGKLVDRFSYDAHGKRRNADWTDATGPITSQTSRGFTGHEMDEEIGLINMNARMYDPVLGRFLSPDTFVQFPETTQGFNRYSYVNNNPLSYTDPSGHFLTAIFAALKFAFGGGAQALLAKIGITGYAGAAGSGLITAGILSGGDTEAMKWGFLTAGLFHGVGNMTNGWGSGLGADVGRVIAHGTAGGAISQAQGGDFWAGFASAGLSKAASGVIDTQFAGADQLSKAQRVVASAVVGGLGSRLAGGSFESGAMTAAFARMFNDHGHPKQSKGKFMLERMKSGQVRDDIFDYGAGLYEGARSIVKGIGGAFRFVGRGLGLYGGAEQTKWATEGLAVDRFAGSYAGSSTVRQGVNQQVKDSVSSIDWSGNNIGRLTGRVITGTVLAPAGALAGIGDFTHTVETGANSSGAHMNNLLLGR